MLEVSYISLLPEAVHTGSVLAMLAVLMLAQLSLSDKNVNFPCHMSGQCQMTGCNSEPCSVALSLNPLWHVVAKVFPDRVRPWG